jgi:hypothetical protein
MSRNNIIKSIINVTDENGNSICYNNITCEWLVSKYSSKKEESWHIIIDGKIISKTCNYLFLYKCQTCFSEHLIGVTQFLRRVKNDTSRCYLCRNKETEKCKIQSQYMKNGRIEKEQKQIIDILKKREISIKLFMEKDNTFQTNYFKTHLTETDFYRISNNIISFDDGKYINSKEIEFWSIIQTNNQMLFSSTCYDTKNKTLIKTTNPIMRCDLCDITWKSKSINKFKTDIKILCKDCTCVNKTFNLKPYSNIKGDKILYQSKLELKFITFCNDSGIIIYNGPRVIYHFNKKQHTYKVDFIVDKYLIEIKDNHIWHKLQVESGKWQAKETAALEYCHKNNLKFMIITPDTWYLTEQLRKI